MASRFLYFRLVSHWCLTCLTIDHFLYTLTTGNGSRLVDHVHLSVINCPRSSVLMIQVMSLHPLQTNQYFLGPDFLLLETCLLFFSNLLMVVFESPVTSLTSLNRIILNAIINTCNFYQCVIYVSGALASPGLIGLFV